ncbi:MAG: dihydroorotase [bacterium]|nr:dihydroorotase [bacterium]
MKIYLIKQATIINEGKQWVGDVLIKNQRIERVDTSIDYPGAIEINAEGHYLVPGAIDDQVHFREPGLTHKGDLFTESRAAAAGGVTSYMEMPNTNPQATTQVLLAEKYARAAQVSLSNYSFFMGTTNDNYDEVMRTNSANVCGIKIFMGSSTGNMLVDNPSTLDHIFANSPMLIATHCEDETTVKNNLALYTAEYGDSLSAIHHALIRNEEACYKSSSMAVELAKRHGTRLHVLHISTAKETNLFSNELPLEKKNITAEACLHHLWFTDADYATKGNWIKWNPAIKSAADRAGIWNALLDGRIDVIATDHAPHTIEEKEQPYAKAPSGGPLVQHSIQTMFQFYNEGKISIEQIVTKMSHNPAILFRIKDRGYIREGYYADLVLVKKEKETVTKDNLLYKCGWSPFEGVTFDYSIAKTFVNGHLAWSDGQLNDTVLGERLLF